MKTPHVIVLSGWLLLLAVPAPGRQKKPAGKGIGADTVAAYEKLGATYGGWMQPIEEGFQPGPKQAEAGLPGFAFKVFPNDKLPDADVAFGLELFESNVTDDGLKGLAGLKHLARLNLFQTQVTDAGVKELAPLGNLTDLCLYNTKVTDAGLKALSGLKKLTVLDISSTPVNDAGLKELAGLADLDYLNLSATKVTGVGLKELAGLKKLTVLGLGDSKLTDAGIKEVGLKKLTVGCGGAARVIERIYRLLEEVETVG